MRNTVNIWRDFLTTREYCMQITYRGLQILWKLESLRVKASGLNSEVVDVSPQRRKLTAINIQKVSVQVTRLKLLILFMIE